MHFQNVTIQALSNKIYNVLETGIAQDKKLNGGRASKSNLILSKGMPQK